jgi:response regulator RpfG family c-di-GMP phosphodiesterase
MTKERAKLSSTWMRWKELQIPRLRRDECNRSNCPLSQNNGESMGEEIAEIAGNHHEKPDGSGYPFKLTGHELSLDAHILTVADIYTARKN